ncbi:OmpH family outer membrane protein [Sandarakinorhabdus sp. DWP1-3-1]|uniref:OmpH family outer membrane protein n=1 Tax=Sandarakinorhabdus sp. DWP1-3-1 TaxID=2804627 RepID=UPI003CED1CC7
MISLRVINLNRGRGPGCFLLLALLAAPAAAQTARPLKICVLSQARLMRESPPALEALARFRGVRAQLAAQVTAERGAIDSETAETDQLARKVDPRVITERRAATAARRANLDAMLAQDAASLETFNQTLTAAVNTAAGPAIMAEERAQRCSLLLAREYVLNVDDSALDITGRVLGRMVAPPR